MGSVVWVVISSTLECVSEGCGSAVKVLYILGRVSVSGVDMYENDELIYILLASHSC